MAVSAARKSAAADMMEHFAAHDESHGYAQDARYGDGRGTCSVDTAIGVVKVKTGDRDCTSGVADALEAVGIGCGGASWTGNYYECMKGTGNFRFHKTSDGSNCDDGYVAQRGDVYLAHNDHWQHAAMCTSADPDMLAEFSINSQGGISGDPVGDQTGRECLVRQFYGGHWDYVIEVVVAEGGGDVQQSPSASLPQPRFRCRRDGKWRKWHEGSGSCGIEGQPMEDFEAGNLGDGGWFQLTLMDGTELPRNQCNDAHTQHVRGITLYYVTPSGQPLHEAVYRVHVVGGGWLKTEYDDDDGGAGDDVHAVDRFQFKLGRCGSRQPF